LSQNGGKKLVSLKHKDLPILRYIELSAGLVELSDMLLILLNENALLILAKDYIEKVLL
jgi:hypothetical protein